MGSQDSLLIQASLEQNRRWLLAYFISATGDPELAGDLVQETFAAALRSSDAFDPLRGLGGWLRGIARNILLRECLEDLTPRARRVVELRYGRRMTSRWIAARTGATGAAVLLFAVLARPKVPLCRTDDGIPVYAGQTVEGKTLVYPDGTTIALGAGAVVRVESAFKIHVHGGVVAADVRPRTLVLASVHCEARVLGTAFKMVVGAESTRLEVTEGKVRLSRGREEVDVNAGFFAVASPGRPLAAHPMAAGFVNVTRESGVADIVSRHYASYPKWWLSGLMLADVDCDGALDLHLGSHSGPTVPAAMGRNDGKGRFTYVDPNPSVPRGVRERGEIPYPGGEIRLMWDVNEDGRPDWLCSWHDGGGVLYVNEGWKARREDLFDPFSRAAAAGDLDRDGDIDYFYGIDRNDKLHVLLGPGFKTRHAVPALMESGAIPADLDGDGDLDLCVSQRGYHPTRRLVLRNDGGLKFAAQDEVEGSIHDVGDVDQNGTLDLICIEDRKVVIHLNDGRMKWTRRVAVENPRPAPSSANWGGAVVTDIDNDGRLDVVACGTGKEKTVDVYKNAAAGGGWVRVRLVGKPGNRPAAGAKIRISSQGRLLWFEQVAIWGRQSFHSYYTAARTERHFGLGPRAAVDVAVEFASGKAVQKKSVPSGTVVLVEE